MHRYDVALWLTPWSWWPDYVAYVQADAASLAVVQLMGAYSLHRVYKAAVNMGMARSVVGGIWSVPRVSKSEWLRVCTPSSQDKPPRWAIGCTVGVASAKG